MDVYSDMRVPFDVATWLRGHRFSPVAVNITRALTEDKDLAERIERLERERTAREQNLRDLIQEARNKMESSNGV